MTLYSKTIEVRKQGLDKFYTNEDTVDRCLGLLYDIYKEPFDLTVEPSAGSGAFLKKIKGNKIGLDIEPEHPDIIKKDFFDYTLELYLNNVLVLGNPPFGKCSSLAIKFFNHSATFADVIAFIIPRTFRRVSLQNKLDKYFHLVLDEELPLNPCCFTPKMSVKCCFQIWEKRRQPRDVVVLQLCHPSWTFLKLASKDIKGQPTPPKDADFAIKAYGGKCGEICTENLDALRPKSWHWIKVNEPMKKETLISNFNKLDYSISLDTARQNSIGKGELVTLYNSMF